MQYDKYYNQGYEAYKNGINLIDNPYNQKSYFHDAWEDGWIDAQDESLHPLDGTVKE